DLKYARWDGAEWQIETVDSYDRVGTGTSLALDSSDRPHISYYDRTNCALKYTDWDGAEWQIETVDTNLGDYGGFTSLVFDSSDYPHISYQDDLNEDLKYARWDGDAWQIETVDSAGRIRWHSSITLDSLDYPHISYFDDYPSRDLKYAWYGDDTAVEDAELYAETRAEGVLVSWTITGDIPVSLRVLRSVDDNEPEDISSALPGSAIHWLDTGIESGVEYRYWLEVVCEDGTTPRFGPVEATWPGPDSDRFTLYAPYPCPVTDRVTLSFYLPEDTRNVELSLYDLSGRLVTSSISLSTTPGRHEITYDTSDLLPGVYLASLTTDTGTLTRRLVITR
ncbi:T9SS type A sorting domain-containing protein, partial [bacterium]|nr:T9SS type A sorting domain-containing protein [bacterium]